MTWESLALWVQVYALGVVACFVVPLLFMGLVLVTSESVRFAEKAYRISSRIVLASWAWPLVAVVLGALGIWKFAEFIVATADLPSLWKQGK